MTVTCRPYESQNNDVTSQYGRWLSLCQKDLSHCLLGTMCTKHQFPPTDFDTHLPRYMVPHARILLILTKGSAINCQFHLTVHWLKHLLLTLLSVAEFR
jgi:hypothetical protein